MKTLIGMITVYSLSACAHWSTPVHSQSEKNIKPEYVYTFQTVTLPVERALSSEKATAKKLLKSNDKSVDKKAGLKEEQKFVAIYKCDKGTNCVESEGNKKLVPYDQFASQVKERAMNKGYDLVDKQQHLLAKGVETLKQERAAVTNENSYYKHQLQFYRYASLRPVVENFKKAHKATESDIQKYTAKIDKFEKDLEYLKNVKGIRLGMDSGTEKVMELVEVGQLQFGNGSEDSIVWKVLQDVAYDLAKN